MYAQNHTRLVGCIFPGAARTTRRHGRGGAVPVALVVVIVIGLMVQDERDFVFVRDAFCRGDKRRWFRFEVRIERCEI